MANGIKGSVKGTILTLTIDLSQDLGVTKNGTGDRRKVAQVTFQDKPDFLPEGITMNLVVLKPLKTAKKIKKIEEAEEEEEEVEEKPVAKKTAKKTAPVKTSTKVPAKKIPAKKATAAPVAKKTTKKVAPVAANDSEDQEQDAFATKKTRKLRAA